MGRCWCRHSLDYIWPEVRWLLDYVPTLDTRKQTAAQARNERVEFLFVELDALLVQRIALAELPRYAQKALAQFDGALHKSIRSDFRELRALTERRIAKGAVRIE